MNGPNEDGIVLLAGDDIGVDGFEVKDILVGGVGLLFELAQAGFDGGALEHGGAVLGDGGTGIASGGGGLGGGGAGGEKRAEFLLACCHDQILSMGA